MSKKLLLVPVLVAIIVIGFIISTKPNSPESTTQPTITPAQQVQRVVPTSEACSGQQTPSLTEGPYYKEGSSQRTNIRDNAEGTKLTVTGIVYDSYCNPISGAWLDFWQADGKGEYDNSGFTLRGQQYTDAEGKYILDTVIPAEYPGRTEHIHVKVRANEESEVLTTQLFFPNVLENQSDSIFNDALLLKVADAQDGKAATYNFVVPVNN